MNLRTGAFTPIFSTSFVEIGIVYTNFSCRLRLLILVFPMFTRWSFTARVSNCFIFLAVGQRFCWMESYRWFPCVAPFQQTIHKVYFAVWPLWKLETTFVRLPASAFPSCTIEKSRDANKSVSLTLHFGKRMIFSFYCWQWSMQFFWGFSFFLHDVFEVCWWKF